MENIVSQLVLLYFVLYDKDLEYINLLSFRNDINDVLTKHNLEVVETFKLLNGSTQYVLKLK
jgi:hypothetical protein